MAKHRKSNEIAAASELTPKTTPVKPPVRTYAGHILLSLAVLLELAYLIYGIGRAGQFTVLLLESNIKSVPAITLFFLWISPFVAKNATMLAALLLVFGVLLIRRARLATEPGNARSAKAAISLAAAIVIMNAALFLPVPAPRRSLIIPFLLTPRHGTNVQH